MICFLADFPGVDNGRFLVLDEGVRGVQVMLSLPLFTLGEGRGDSSADFRFLII